MKGKKHATRLASSKKGDVRRSKRKVDAGKRTKKVAPMGKSPARPAGPIGQPISSKVTGIECLSVRP